MTFSTRLLLVVIAAIALGGIIAITLMSKGPVPDILVITVSSCVGAVVGMSYPEQSPTSVVNTPPAAPLLPTKTGE